MGEGEVSGGPSGASEVVTLPALGATGCVGGVWLHHPNGMRHRHKGVFVRAGVCLSRLTAVQAGEVRSRWRGRQNHLDKLGGRHERGEVQ